MTIWESTQSRGSIEISRLPDNFQPDINPNFHKGLYNTNSIKLSTLPFQNNIEDLTSQHVDRRLQLLFFQLISCYNTPFHFEFLAAEDQVGKGSKTTQAAHSSTFPCLMAYPIKEWENFKNKKEKKPNGFVYLKYSNGYWQQNATVELPSCVNKTDTLIDGRANTNGLRSRSIEIINQVALKKLLPREGFIKFFEKFYNVVDEKLKSKEYEHRHIILRKYLNRLYEVHFDLYSPNTKFFDYLVGVQFKNPETELLRKIVFEKRFKLIQKCQKFESTISKKIFEAQYNIKLNNLKTLDPSKIDSHLEHIILNIDFALFFPKKDSPKSHFQKIFREFFENSPKNLEKPFRDFVEKHKKSIIILFQKLNEIYHDANSKTEELVLLAKEVLKANHNMTKPFFIDCRFRYALLNLSKNFYKKRFEKFFCTSTDQMNLSSSKYINKCKDFEKKHETKIKNLIKAINKLFQKIELHEFKYRSHLFKDLRTKFKYWTQVEFVEKFKEIYPNSFMSQAMVSRLEYFTRISYGENFYKTPIDQRRKFLELRKAKEISDIFDINAGLFISSLYL